MVSERGLSTKKPRFRIGPGALITAAFIGPGTITTCSIAGAKFGFALLWGLVFSVLATVVLQEMAARLGIITRQGLGEALRKHFNKGLPKLLTIFLVISAITIGNAAFETGNILGATLGLEALFARVLPSNKIFVLLIGSATFILLYIGSYKVIEKAMVALVILMSLTFLTTAIIVLPSTTGLLRGLFMPSLPSGSLLPLVGLIGTTVVPYNLFLYAAAVQERFRRRDELPAARADMMISVIIGGLISMAIVISAAVAFYGTGDSPAHTGDLAVQLAPLLGSWAKYFIAAGLFAAGISSAITAPLAAAYATMGILGWERNMRSWRFRLVWMLILLAGMVFSLLGLRPMEVILFAQAANGILLPVIAVYLLWIVNSKRVMGNDTNSVLSNILGIIVVIITVGLGLRSLLYVFGTI
jgi:NRAMP (natural resistance-associated macrophage protein)-like metal ion transporter